MQQTQVCANTLIPIMKPASEKTGQLIKKLPDGSKGADIFMNLLMQIFDGKCPILENRTKGMPEAPGDTGNDIAGVIAKFTASIPLEVSDMMIGEGEFAEPHSSPILQMLETAEPISDINLSASNPLNISHVPEPTEAAPGIQSGLPVLDQVSDSSREVDRELSPANIQTDYRAIDSSKEVNRQLYPVNLQTDRGALDKLIDTAKAMGIDIEIEEMKTGSFEGRLRPSSSARNVFEKVFSFEENNNQLEIPVENGAKAEPVSSELTQNAADMTEFPENYGLNPVKSEDAVHDAVPDTKNDEPFAARLAIGLKEEFVSSNRLEATSAPQKASLQPLNYHKISNQIVKGARLMHKAGISEMTLQLKPASLGRIHLRLAKDELGNVSIEMQSPSGATKTMLEGKLSELRQAFERQNIEINNISITSPGEASQAARTETYGNMDRDGFAGRQREHNFPRHAGREGMPEREKHDKRNLNTLA